MSINKCYISNGRVVHNAPYPLDDCAKCDELERILFGETDNEDEIEGAIIEHDRSINH